MTTGCGVAVGALLVVGAEVGVAHPARARAVSPAITNLGPRTVLDLSPAAMVSISLMWRLNDTARSAASVAPWSSVVSHLRDNSLGRSVVCDPALAHAAMGPPPAPSVAAIATTRTLTRE